MSKVEFDSLVPALSAEPGVVAAWLFGSSRDGDIGPGADLDIGILWEGKPSLDELAGLRARLQTASGFDDIDLVVLNEASPILRFEAVSGLLLCCRDDGRRAVFASLTAREYEDEMTACVPR